MAKNKNTSKEAAYKVKEEESRRMTQQRYGSREISKNPRNKSGVVPPRTTVFAPR